METLFIVSLYLHLLLREEHKISPIILQKKLVKMSSQDKTRQDNNTSGIISSLIGDVRTLIYYHEMF